MTAPTVAGQRLFLHTTLIRRILRNVCLWDVEAKADWLLVESQADIRVPTSSSLRIRARLYWLNHKATLSQKPWGEQMAKRLFHVPHPTWCKHVQTVFPNGKEIRHTQILLSQDARLILESSGISKPPFMGCLCTEKPRRTRRVCKGDRYLRDLKIMPLMSDGEGFYSWRLEYELQQAWVNLRVADSCTHNITQPKP